MKCGGWIPMFRKTVLPPFPESNHAVPRNNPKNYEFCCGYHQCHYHKHHICVWTFVTTLQTHMLCCKQLRDKYDTYVHICFTQHFSFWNHKIFKACCRELNTQNVKYKCSTLNDNLILCNEILLHSVHKHKSIDFR